MGQARRYVSPVIFFIGIFSLVGTGCSGHKAVPPLADSQTENSDTQADLVMQKFKVQSYDSAGLAWEMDSPVARAYNNKRIMVADNMHIRLFENGQPSTRIQCDTGTINTSTDYQNPNLATRDLESGLTLQPGDMVLTGNVVLTSTDGAKMMTDWIHYHKLSLLITSTAPVHVIRDDSETFGVGLEATSSMSNIKIFNQTVVIKGKDEESPKK